MSARSYLYGRGDAEIWALLRDRAFWTLTRTLFDGPPTVCRPSDETQQVAADRALSCELLRRAEDGFDAGRRLVMVPSAALQEAIEAMAPGLDRYVAITSEAVGRLVDAYERTEASRHLPWNRTEHAVIAGMLLDLSVGSQLWLRGEIAQAYDETAVWVFQEKVGQNAFGVQWIQAEARASGFAQLWHQDVERPDLRLPPSAVGALLDQVLDDLPLPPRDRLLLRHLGLIRAADGDRCAIPAFSPPDMERHLLPVLWETASLLVEQAAVPALTEATKVSWWVQRGERSSSRHALVRALLEAGVDRVIAAGVLSPFPAGQASPGWGRWLWAERPGPRTLVAGAFGHGPAPMPVEEGL